MYIKLKYSYGRNEEPSYKRDKNHVNKLLRWMVPLINEYETSPYISFRDKAVWKLRTDGEPSTESMIDVFSIFDPDDAEITPNRYRLWVDRSIKDNPLLLRLIPEYINKENDCQADATDKLIECRDVNTCGHGDLIDHLGTKPILNSLVYPFSLETHVNKKFPLEMDHENYVLKRKGRIRKAHVGYQGLGYCNKDNYQIGRISNQLIQYTGYPTCCNDLESYIRESNVFFHIENSFKHI